MSGKIHLCGLHAPYTFYDREIAPPPPPPILFYTHFGKNTSLVDQGLLVFTSSIGSKTLNYNEKLYVVSLIVNCQFNKGQFL